MGKLGTRIYGNGGFTEKPQAWLLATIPFGIHESARERMVSGVISEGGVRGRINQHRWMSRGISLPVGQGRSKYVVLSRRAVRRSSTPSLTAVIAVKQAAFIIVRTFPCGPTRNGCPRFRAMSVSHGAPSRVHAFTRLKTSSPNPVVLVIVPCFWPSNEQSANVEPSLSCLSSIPICSLSTSGREQYAIVVSRGLKAPTEKHR